MRQVDEGGRKWSVSLGGDHYLLRVGKTHHDHAGNDQCANTPQFCFTFVFSELFDNWKDQLWSDMTASFLSVRMSQKDYTVYLLIRVAHPGHRTVVSASLVSVRSTDSSVS